MALRYPSVALGLSLEGIAINKHLKAFSIPKDHARRGTIFIKDGLDAIEKKLLLAEEFRHLYAHYQSQLSLDQYTIGKCENQAKRMAAYLPMPGRFIEDVYADAYEAPVVISDIADYFLVTDETAAYRIELEFQHKLDGFVASRGKLGTLEWID
ncbi:ImmA/IrrE family metallo-endopeptidase [Sporosarcina sp. P29]|uniref:ImmA/IrrE family metallo-endopeptidase n=1 Tax=Sporosarcina sp. P29 TaxID=2048252 RepID=UPI0013043882|nr:ImmA/IrrE family metallo-endopeptidase [Sporosarcina sp. P29]